MRSELEFFRPKDLEEALSMLAEPGGNHRVIAGGTDIIPGMHQGAKRFENIERLVAIDHLRELNRIVQKRSFLEIGAAVNFSMLAQDPLIRSTIPLLAEAAKRIGSVQIRNRATIGGNLVNNAPCADSAPPLLVYDAGIRIRSFQTETEMPLSELLTGSYRTRLGPDQLVTAIRVPLPEKGWIGRFYKLGRRRGVAVSRISLAILIRKNGGRLESCRFACGAVTPVAVRLYDLERQCTGQRVTRDFLKDIARQLGEEVLKITGLRWSGPYKIPVIQQVFYQLLCELTEGDR